jgi:hypothetical protein
VEAMNDEEILLLPRAKLEKGKGLRLLVAFQGKRNVPVHEAKRGSTTLECT